MEFIKCSECGKKLIVRNEDGTLRFIFGRKYGDTAPVDMIIDGNVEISCIRNGCNNKMKIYKDIQNENSLSK